jgi:hypothetical protein
VDHKAVAAKLERKVRSARFACVVPRTRGSAHGHHACLDIGYRWHLASACARFDATGASVQVAAAAKQLAKAEAQRAGAQAAADREAAAYATVTQRLTNVETEAVTELRGHATAPPATMHAVTAVLHLLRKPEGTFATWNRAGRYFSEACFFFLRFEQSGMHRAALLTGRAAAKTLASCTLQRGQLTRRRADVHASCTRLQASACAARACDEDKLPELILTACVQELFDELAAYDAAQERDASVWKGVRAAYKAVDKAKAAEVWAFEMPETALGALLMLYIKAVRSFVAVVFTRL